MGEGEGVSGHIQPSVLVLFVEIDPCLRSVQTGRHFAGHSASRTASPLRGRNKTTTVLAMSAKS
jgi:hypothetical protein